MTLDIGSMSNLKVMLQVTLLIHIIMTTVIDNTGTLNAMLKATLPINAIMAVAIDRRNLVAMLPAPGGLTRMTVVIGHTRNLDATLKPTRPKPTILFQQVPTSFSKTKTAMKSQGIAAVRLENALYVEHENSIVE